MKKLFAIALALMLCISVLSVAAFAAFADGFLLSTEKRGGKPLRCA